MLLKNDIEILRKLFSKHNYITVSYTHLDVYKRQYLDYGTYDTVRCNYPEYALKAANAVASKECDRGILCCGTGVGISIAANKVKGIRCVVCSDPYSALLSRQHNDSNMLAMGSRVVGKDLALMILRCV